MKMTQADFEKLVADVEKEFDLFLAKAESEAKPEATLAKSEDESDKKESEEKEEHAKTASAKAEDEKEEKDDEDKHDYDDEDVEEMHKMYSSMGKAELGLHKSAMEKCWMEKCGDMSVMKSEKSENAEPLKKAEEAALFKSELEAKTKENEELKKHMEELVSAMNNFFAKKGPTRKAITSIEYVKKSEIENAKPEPKNLTKSEVTAILNKKAADPTLSKADREAINNYYLKGGNLETVKHLLAQ
jgi:hypothetical protein